MSKLTELERLQKNVVETKAAYDAAGEAYDVAQGNAIHTRAAAEADDAAIAYDAWVKARLELEDYLKEQDNAK